METGEPKGGDTWTEALKQPRWEMMAPWPRAVAAGMERGQRKREPRALLGSVLEIHSRMAGLGDREGPAASGTTRASK